MNRGVDRAIRSGVYLNIPIRHTIWTTGISAIRMDGRFMRHSLIGVREVGNFVPGVGNLILWVERLFRIPREKEFLRQTG